MEGLQIALGLQTCCAWQEQCPTWNFNKSYQHFDNLGD